MLTQKMLKEVVSYDPKTGSMRWRIGRGRRVIVGREIGCVNHEGYRYASVLGKKYVCHRLAWLYVHGKFPEFYIDHINGNPSDNRIDNLRIATNHQNQGNSKKKSTNSSGVKGVRRHGHKWRAEVTVNRKRIHLGLFANLADAKKAYDAAAIAAFGEYHRP